MKTIGVIPARWASTRLKGKILAEIAGKPMVQHVWERAGKSAALSEVIIACDDERVMKAAQGFGAKAVLTSPDHKSGTDRIVEVVKDLETDAVVNIQGDEPLIDASMIDDLIKILADDPQASMATVIKASQNSDEFRDPHTVKVVVDHDRNALYFSRAPVPHHRDQEPLSFYKHLGIYAYRKDFLLKYHELPASGLEQKERLEQLRALEAGYKIKTVTTDIETISVDTAEDLARAVLKLS